jgi:histone H3/H4
MPLPTYQQSGLLSQPTQRLDFADLRETERSSQMMSQSLDRLSEFAFKAAAKKAIREGEQWAYNNPISDEQIAAAKRGALDIALEAPKAGTFFGDSARKIQAGQLRSTLELQARSEIARIYQDVESGAITDIKTLDDQFYAIQKGNGKVIASLDPEQANAFQASIATAANPVYQAGAKKIGELRAKYIEDLVTRSLDNYDPLLRSLIDENTDPKRISDEIQIHRKALLGQAVQTNNVAAFTAVQKTLDSKIEKAYIDRISNYLSSDEFSMSAPDTSFSSRLAALESGNAGKYQAVWSTLTTELQDKIKTQFLKREGEKEKSLQVDQKAKDIQNKEESIDALNKYYKGEMGQEELVNTLIATKQATPALLKSVYAGEEKTTDAKTLFFIGNQIDKGLFGRENVEKYHADGKITLKESLDFIKQIKTESRDFADAKMILKGKLKLPADGLILGDQYKKQQEKYGSMLADLINASNEAIASGKPFNPIAYANKMAVEGTSQLSQENIKKKDEALAAKWRSLGYTPPADGTFFTPLELERTPTPDKKKTLSKEDIKIILRLQKNAQEARE